MTVRLATGTFPHDLPALAVPAGDAASVDALAAWLTTHRDEVRAWLAQYGAVLLRGFALTSADCFSRCMDALGEPPMPYLHGTSPRSRVDREIYTSTEAPPALPIPLHNEMSYRRPCPRYVAFFCETAPLVLGATPLVDMRRVYADIPAELRQRFDTLGIRYVRRIPRRVDRYHPTCWPRMYGTDDAEKVAALCKSDGYDVEWGPRATLHLVNTHPASVAAPQANGHEVPGRRVWFNQVVVFHSSLFQEFARHGNHGVQWFLRMRRALRRLAPRFFPYPYDAMFGDGSAIDDRAMRAVRDAHWRNETFFRWQAGDLLLIDNLIVGHGRQPFRGPRRILAALRGSMSP
jgi:alpha-ketoglutarate-dependent taurine dioxygenase